MNKKIRLLAILFLISLILSGCFTWTRIEKPKLKGPKGAYFIEAPLGWKRLYDENKIFITFDGPLIQSVEIQKFDFRSAFKKAGTKISDNTLVTELAELYVANFMALRPEMNIRPLETKPAMIDNKPGFRLHLEAVNPKGLIFDIIAYGFRDKKSFYHLKYEAPRLYFFERDLPVFEKIVQSFHIKNA